MPDSIGRYTLAEMRKRVWRRLDSYKWTDVNQDGTVPVTAELVVSPQYTDEDVNEAINTALVGLHTDLITNYPLAFADEDEIDLVADHTEYSLPEDLVQLRGLYWKPPWDTRTVVPINERQFMYQMDDNPDIPPLGDAPTYRRQLNFFVLNQIPTEDNAGGVLVRYVKHVNYLADDAAIIETEFARQLQEVVCIDAAIDLIQTRGRQEVPTWKDDRQIWMGRLVAIARGAQQPPFVQMYYANPVPFEGRR